MIQGTLVDPGIQNVVEMTRWEPYGSDIFMPDLLEWHLYRGVFPHHANPLLGFARSNLIRRREKFLSDTLLPR